MIYYIDFFFFVDVVGYDFDFVFFSCNYVGIVWFYEYGIVGVNFCVNVNYIDYGYIFGDCNDDFDFCIEGFENCVCCKWWWYEDYCCIGVG